MAADEGLLRDGHDHGDKLLAGLRPCPEWHRQQILEQVLLNSKLHTLWDIPFDWLEGEFLGHDILQYERTPGGPHDSADAVSPEILEGLLVARGEERPFDDWIPIIERSKEILIQIDAFELAHQGATFKPMEHKVRGMVDPNYRDSEAYLLATRWNEAQVSAQPLLSVVDEFLELSEAATTGTRFLKTPVYCMSANLIRLRADATVDSAATRVYRLATEQLGVLPICNSLRQALELGRRPEVAALRSMLDEWLPSLDRDVADVTAKIQADIARASTHLVNGNRLLRVGQFLGYASIPASAAGIVHPLFNALGISMSCVAVVLERSGHAMRKHVDWLGFGTRVTG
jgi:hypothetical protein